MSIVRQERKNHNMKILYLTEVLYGQGGTEMYLYRLVTRLNRDHITPIVCPLQPKESDMIQKLRQQNIKVKPVLITKLFALNTLIKAYHLAHYIRQNKISIIQTHHFAADVFGTMVAHWARVPVIISARRDMGFNEDTFSCRFSRRLLNPLTHKLLTNASAMKRDIRINQHVPDKKIMTIYNGVDLDRFNNGKTDRDQQCQQLGLNPNRKHVGVIANIRPIKGLEYFLQAIPMILARHPDTEFLIVGGDATFNKELDQYKKTLNDIINRHHLHDKVHFLGRRKEIIPIMRILDVYVCSSLSEGFSNSIIEAMATGIPVVATDVGGNSEAVEDTVTGFIVPPADAHAIANCVNRLLQDKQLCNDMGTRAVQRVQQNFTIDKAVEQHKTLYTTLLNSVTQTSQPQ
jgi:glycosyltransferase involved in cell wall biosynthesis